MPILMPVSWTPSISFSAKQTNLFLRLRPLDQPLLGGGTRGGTSASLRRLLSPALRMQMEVGSSKCFDKGMEDLYSRSLPILLHILGPVTCNLQHSQPSPGLQGMFELISSFHVNESNLKLLCIEKLICAACECNVKGKKVLQ